ncbi:MAG: hypothetical protein COA58_01780 [Bacteroidetes bacterium]|nr:MAG: hypothetical protein COA58_01780 [Bacteroidota bacterium]
MNLAKEISFLLYKHNCVILPSFGAFLINEKNAERSEVAKYSLPKQEVISFNRQIINQDGLVANHLSQLLNISYEAGVQKVEEYISNLWDVLNTKRNVEVAEVGTFYFTQEEKLVFVPYHSVNFSRSSFGLPKLRLKQISITHTTDQTLPVVSEITNPIEIVEPIKLEAPKPQKLKEKKEKRIIASQNKKLKKKIVQTKKSNTTISNLSIINALGSIFLVAMVFALLNFEMTNSTVVPTGNDLASMVDSQNFSTNDLTKPVIKTSKSPVSYGIYAQVKNENAATDLVNDLIGKYHSCQVEINDDSSTEVFIISFSNEEIAKEYKNLIQNKLDQKLVIKQK